MSLERQLQSIWQLNRRNGYARLDLFRKKGELVLGNVLSHQDLHSHSAAYTVVLDPSCTNLIAQGGFKFPRALFRGKDIILTREYELMLPDYFYTEVIEPYLEKNELTEEDVCDVIDCPDPESLKVNPIDLFFPRLDAHPWLSYEPMQHIFDHDFNVAMNLLDGLGSEPVSQFSLIVDNHIMYYAAEQHAEGQPTGFHVYGDGEEQLKFRRDAHDFSCRQAYDMIVDVMKAVNAKGKSRVFNSLNIATAYNRERPGAILGRRVLQTNPFSMPLYIPDENSFSLLTDFDNIDFRMKVDFRNHAEFFPWIVAPHSILGKGVLEELLYYLESHRTRPSENVGPNLFMARQSQIEDDVHLMHTLVNREKAAEEDRDDGKSDYTHQLFRIKEGSSKIDANFNIDDDGTIYIRPDIAADFLKPSFLGLEEVDFIRQFKFGKGGMRALDEEDYRRAVMILGSYPYPVTEFKARGREKKASLVYRDGKFHFFNWYSSPYRDLGIKKYDPNGNPITTQQVFEMLNLHKNRGVSLTSLKVEGECTPDAPQLDRLAKQFFTLPREPVFNYMLVSGSFKGMPVYLNYCFNPNQPQPQVYLQIQPFPNMLGKGVVTEFLGNIAQVIGEKVLSER